MPFSTSMKLDDLDSLSGGTLDGGRGRVTPLEQPSEANFLCACDEGKLQNRLTQFPVEILPFLYLGDAECSSDLNVLKERGIKFILNVTPDLPNVYENVDDFQYMKIPVDDHWSQSLSVYFSKAFRFIDEARNQSIGVLVHCWAGISRSVTIIVAYIMRTMSMNMEDAYDFVKSRNPNIAPNLNFMGQLLDFERELYGGNTPDSQVSVNSASSTNSAFDASQDDAATSYLH